MSQLSDEEFMANIHRLRPRHDDGPPTLPIEAYRNEAPPEPERRSRFFSASELDGRPVPPREWLVEELVPSGTVTILGGDGGTGKSLIALQLAVAISSTGWWLGRQVKTGPAVYVSAEDDEEELHRRLADIVRAEDIGLVDLERLSVRSLAGEDALLATLVPGTGVLAATALLRELEAYLEEVAPALLVLDTLADLFSGNENDRAHARQFIGMLRGLAIKYRCAVIVLAHPSLTGLNSGSGTSGSTGWNNSSRSRLYLERVVQDGYEADPDARVLRTKKANHARVGGEIAVRWQDGVFVAEPGESGLDRLAASSKAERVFLKLLELLADQGRKVNHAGGRSYAPNVFSAHPEAEGCARRALAAAMESLLAKGRIVVSEDGPPSKRRQFLEVAK